MGRLPGPGGSGGGASLAHHRRGVGVRDLDPVGGGAGVCAGSRTGARAGRRGRARPLDRQRAQVIEGSLAQPLRLRLNRRPSCLSGISADAFDQEPFEVPRGTPRPTLM
jgi:hypothetical protein